MNKTVLWIGFFCSFCCLSAKAQQLDSILSKELNFIDYLLTEEDHDGALYLLDQIHPQSSALLDSIHYLKGWTYYKIKSLDSSAYYLSLVGERSSQFQKAQLFSSLSSSYTGDYAKAKQGLNVLEQSNLNNLSGLINLEYAGISLLSGEYGTFKSYAQNFKGEHYAWKDEEARMVLYYDDLLRTSKKSPFVAGVMSALIPGAGKVYAGRTGEGVAAFLQHLVLGAITAELYVKNGPKNGFFIASACLFSFFYIGNIWGSALSVNISKAQYQHEIKHRILFDMHIPLRVLFP